MAPLLDLLRDEAVSLVESELPSGEEVRSLVGAVVKRLERLERHVVGQDKAAGNVWTESANAGAAEPQAKAAPVQPQVSEPPAVEPPVEPPAPVEPAVAETPQVDSSPAERELEQAERDLAAALARVEHLQAQR